MKLIVGLGNPGVKYQGTRHNIGFDVIDALALDRLIELRKEPLGFVGRDSSTVLLKPTTGMNNSGKAVMHYLKPGMELLVIVDDLHLPFGNLRFRPRGRDGGHNGLKSIAAELGHIEYARLRIGIGKDFQGSQLDFVLGRWEEEEYLALPQIIKSAVDEISTH